ncbi:hypothetical protein GSY71_17435 [Pusillimonas sp. TS35]|uniref:DUF6776 family protein n=1 Tax=Paracandidimonas lactea TaxID=2895524 RepID=UPI00136AF6B3|nr:DUF6776 family protein [Paracandidimonas lactea]MYN14924.1 hypothetical protein [Pusillimonas sp. TS35]
MFGSRKRNVFTPTAYGSARRSRRIPRWFLLLLAGIVLGAGGLLFLQKSYGPQRLTVEQSEQLHYDLNSLGIDKQRLQSELAQTSRSLSEAQTRLTAQEKALTEANASVETLKKDVAMLANAMPPDPRGTSPGIRAADFNNRDGQLAYQLLLMQDANKAAQTFTGHAEMIVTGRYPNGRTGTVSLPAVDLSLGRYTQLQGMAELPAGFQARRVTVNVRGQGSDKVVATRTLIVSR